MRIVIAVILCGLAMGGCSWINKQLGISDDSLAEEWIEDEIKEQYGLSIDLTPFSPES